MTNLNFTIDQDDGLNVWIKQTLQDELTGAEFSKLENVLESRLFQDITLDDLQDKISAMLKGSSISADELEAIKTLIEKSKEILLEQADGLSADDIREICQVEQGKVPGASGFYRGGNDESSENNAIAIMKFFLTGKEFRAIKEWLDSSTNEIKNDLLEKITTTLKKGLEAAIALLVLVSVGGHHLNR